MKIINLIIIAVMLVSAGCERKREIPKKAKQRQLLPESRDKTGKLTRPAVTWISDGSPEQIQWIHDHCANVDPIPLECIPFMASPAPSATPGVSPSVTPSVPPSSTPLPTPTATKTPTAAPTQAPTATTPPQTLCVVPNLIGTKIKDAQEAWNGAGFTTTVVVTSGAPGHQIASQSLPAGSKQNCDSVIKVSN